MLTHINRGPVITVKDPLRPGQYKQFRNPDWNEMPEIVSFTQFLTWNYLMDYGQHIRRLHHRGQLPLPWYIDFDSTITNVSIRDGKFDGIDAQAPEGWTKWVVPGYEYIYVECESMDTFPIMIEYLNKNDIKLAGAVHDFTDPKTGKNYMFFPIRKL